MSSIIKILMFVIANVIGFYAFLFIHPLSIRMGFDPNLETTEAQLAFKNWFITGGVMVWLAMAFVSIGLFFSKTRLKYWLALSPIYVPISYAVVVLTYFKALFAS